MCDCNIQWIQKHIRSKWSITSYFINAVFIQVDLTTENNIAVLISLNELVMNSTDNDQSIDNIIIVSNIMNHTAMLISGHATTLSPSNLAMVRIHCT